MSSCSLSDNPTHYRTITIAKFLPNGLGLLLSKWAHLCFTPLTQTHLSWGRATGPWSHSSWSCYSLHKMLSLLSAVSKIPLHFLSQNSSVAAYASERAIEDSETRFGWGRAEESWSLGVCQARSITSSHFVLLFPTISLSGTRCCCVSLLGLLERLNSLSEKEERTNKKLDRKTGNYRGWQMKTFVLGVKVRESKL